MSAHCWQYGSKAGNSRGERYFALRSAHRPKYAVIGSIAEWQFLQPHLRPRLGSRVHGSSGEGSDALPGVNGRHMKAERNCDTRARHVGKRPKYAGVVRTPACSGLRTYS